MTIKVGALVRWTGPGSYIRSQMEIDRRTREDYAAIEPGISGKVTDIISGELFHDGQPVYILDLEDGREWGAFCDEVELMEEVNHEAD